MVLFDTTNPLSRAARALTITLALTVVLAPPQVNADTLYVTDILRLGLHAAADTSDKPFRVLVSGDTLEVIERSQFYARVRTSDGVEGYVKTSYLVEEKPAKTQFVDLTNERDRLAAQVGELSSRIDQQDAELAALRGDRDSLESNALTVANEISMLRVSNASLTEQVAANRMSVPLHWLLAVAAAMLLGGFAGGWWWFDSRQRARHGGFRI